MDCTAQVQGSARAPLAILRHLHWVVQLDFGGIVLRPMTMNRSDDPVSPEGTFNLGLCLAAGRGDLKLAESMLQAALM